MKQCKHGVVSEPWGKALRIILVASVL